MKSIKRVLSSSFVQQLSVYTVSSYINKAIPFLLLPLFTRFLSTEDYGQVAMFSALISLLISITSWSGDGALLRKYYEVKKEKLSGYLFNYLLISLVSLIIISLFLFLFNERVSELSGVPTRWLLLAVVATLCTIICYYVNSYHQASEQPVHYALFTNGWTLSEALLSIVFIVVLGLGASGRAYGISTAYIIFAIIGLIILKKEVGISAKIDKVAIKEELSVFGFPSLPMNLRGTILQFVDRLFIANMVSLSAVGVYAAGSQLAMVIEVFVRSISLALTPWMYKKLQEGNNEAKYAIVKLIYILVIGIVLISLLWWVVATVGATIILGEDFVGSTAYLGWLIVSRVFMGLQLIMVNFIYFYKRTKAYAVLSIISIFLQIALNYVLVSREGALGAAIATTIVYAFTFVVTLLIINRIVKLPWLKVLRIINKS